MPEVHYCNLTFYGFDDNDDGEGNYGTAVIAYPNPLHSKAKEDKGSFLFPSTFATTPKLFKPGTRIYVPRLKKYFIMEDECRSCEKDWEKGIKHIDIFIGSSTKKGGRALIKREEELTLEKSELVYEDPPNDLPVNEKPLWTE